MHILCIAGGPTPPRKNFRETPCAVGECGTRTTPTPSETGGPTEATPTEDGDRATGRRPPGPRPGARPRRERSADRPAAPRSSGGRGPPPRRWSHGRRPGRPGGGRGPADEHGGRRCVRRSGRSLRGPAATERAGDRERVAATDERTACTDIGSRGPGQPGRTAGGRAAGPLDLIHRGAPHLSAAAARPGPRMPHAPPCHGATRRDVAHCSPIRPPPLARASPPVRRPPRPAALGCAGDRDARAGRRVGLHRPAAPGVRPAPRRRRRPGRGRVDLGALRGGPAHRQGPAAAGDRTRRRRRRHPRGPHALQPRPRRRPRLVPARGRGVGRRPPAQLGPAGPAARGAGRRRAPRGRGRAGRGVPGRRGARRAHAAPPRARRCGPAAAAPGSAGPAAPPHPPPTPGSPRAGPGPFTSARRASRNRRSAPSSTSPSASR